MRTLEHIIVPVDETRQSERALPVASALAARAGAAVELVTVDSPKSPVLEMTAYHHRVAAAHLRGVRWFSRIELTDEGVAETLVDRSDDLRHSMLCMATHARNAMSDVILGSVGDRVIELSHDWLLMVGPRCVLSDKAVQGWLHGPVNVFLDGSERDPNLVDTATRWAELIQRPVVFAAIVPPGVQRDREVAEEELRSLGAITNANGTATSAIVVESFDLAGSILRVQHANGGSIVLGSHQRSAYGRFAFGSNAIRAAHNAPTPVVIATHPLPAVVGR